MAKVFIEESTLTAIGNAIREKEGTTALVPVNDMATRITSLPSGSGEGFSLPSHIAKLSGNIMHMFREGYWDWIIDDYGNQITTENLGSVQDAFNGCECERIPFTLNMKNGASSFSSAFSGTGLTESPKIRGTLAKTKSLTLDGLIYASRYLRDVEDLFEPDAFVGLSEIVCASTSGFAKPCKFNWCYSLRRLPTWWYTFRPSETSTTYPSASNMIYASAFDTAVVLDEARNIPVWKMASTAAITSNYFSSTFNKTYRLKAATFETDNGQPRVVNWKSQTIDLTQAGVSTSRNDVTGYNSGITADKEVTDDATYQALKNDPDWFTLNSAYSRYNHDSAVETINSLPDASAYGTNTIKFKGANGASTDGGAINTLTAEEIAVATAKGWTVTLV